MHKLDLSKDWVKKLASDALQRRDRLTEQATAWAKPELRDAPRDIVPRSVDYTKRLRNGKQPR